MNGNWLHGASVVGIVISQYLHVLHGGTQIFFKTKLTLATRTSLGTRPPPSTFHILTHKLLRPTFSSAHHLYAFTSSYLWSSSWPHHLRYVHHSIHVGALLCCLTLCCRDDTRSSISSRRLQYHLDNFSQLNANQNKATGIKLCLQLITTLLTYLINTSPFCGVAPCISRNSKLTSFVSLFNSGIPPCLISLWLGHHTSSNTTLPLAKTHHKTPTISAYSPAKESKKTMTWRLLPSRTIYSHTAETIRAYSLTKGSRKPLQDNSYHYDASIHLPLIPHARALAQHHRFLLIFINTMRQKFWSAAYGKHDWSKSLVVGRA